MYRNVLKTATVVVAVSFAQVGHACKEATLPQLPKADTAVLAEMVKAQKEVKKYLQTSEEFLKCVRDDRRHNDVVDKMHDLAARFNTLTKAYKARKNS